jgi:adenine-specific DNA-methyltransferase
MDKLRMQTANKADENFKKLAAMFPNAVTETINENGEVVRAIDKDVLMQEISCKVVDGNEERYQFTWPDKKKSVLLANAPINRTLRPVREDETVPTGADSEGKPYCSTGSVDFDTTENLYIEGDNLEVLKLLQETYLGKVKMIYIDPPYNTGNDFVYEDDFAQSAADYMNNSGQYDEEGNRLVTNTESNGRFHTDWLNMIYPRLRLAKDLLADDGVIFISIDDNEQENLKKCCDEIFGADNFIAQMVWQKRTSPDARRIVSAGHEYVLAYIKNSEIGHEVLNPLPFDDADYARYKNPDNDPNGPWISTDCTAQGGHGTKDQFYDMVTPAGRVVKLQEGLCWRYTKKRMEEEIAAGHIWFGSDGNGVPRKKTYLADRAGKTMWTWWPNTEVGHTQEATKEIATLLGQSGIMDFPKPIRLMKRIVHIASKKDSIILDFFSGSATTAHAVMKLNAEDGGHRKFIMVQLPEKTDEKSEAYKAGYKNICEIGKERIRRAGAKIKEEAGLAAQNLDTGFRVLKCDTSNMKDVYYNPAEYEVNMFSRLEDNIKEDRTPEDLLFQVMLDLGVLLSSKIEETTIAGKKVFNVEDNYLIACFDSDVSEETIKAIAKQKPYYFVMRDSSMASDSVATNFDQIFATYSPDTVRKVL